MKDLPFAEIWAVDFEFGAGAREYPDIATVDLKKTPVGEGERPAPRCMVARELRSSRTIALWADELRALSSAPFTTGPQALFVAYYSSAEFGCFEVLGWPLPENVCDLCIEFKLRTSGLSVPCGRDILGALAYFGISGIDAAEKDHFRKLALRGGVYSDEEKRALIAYCQTDIDALERLLSAMVDEIDLDRALLRGNFMKVAARVEHRGIPIDVPYLEKLRGNWEAIQEKLIDRINPSYQVYEGRTFKLSNFERYLSAHGIPWPRTETGRLSLEDDVFRGMAKAYPVISPLRELRHSLSELRLNKLAVGSDNRNRTLLGAFGSVTGRNQPSNSKFIFGPSVWLRGLIKPEPGMALANIDFSAEEFAISAYLSGDRNMISAYESDDVYLGFAKLAGAVPSDATKQSHPAERALFKTCVLGTQYGMGERTLALRIGKSLAHGRELLEIHRKTFPEFWAWSQGALDFAMLNGYLETTFGWRIHVNSKTRLLTLRNFPVQGNGSEILRIAAILATEAGVRICAPVHDAFLIEAPIEEIESGVEKCQEAMRLAGQAVLGHDLRSDCKIVRYPDRFMDEERGRVMWDVVEGILTDLKAHP